MNAYLVEKYKSPIKAGEAAEPTVGDRDVLVDLHAAGVNMLDAKIRDGEFKLVVREDDLATKPAASAPFTRQR